MTKLRSGAELTEVRKDVNLDGRVAVGKPQNQYLDGKRGTRGTGNVMNLKSTGFGPSKMNVNEQLPTLLNLEERLISYLDSIGTVHLHMLASGIKGDPAEVATAVRSLVKRSIVAETTRHGGGITLMAEGRRIAGLLAERRR